MHTCGRQSDDSIRGDGAQWAEHRAQLVRHVLVGDADPFLKVLGAADKALNVSPRVYVCILVARPVPPKHPLAVSEPGRHRIGPRLAYAHPSPLSRPADFVQTPGRVFLIRLSR